MSYIINPIHPSSFHKHNDGACLLGGETFSFVFSHDTSHMIARMRIVLRHKSARFKVQGMCVRW